MTVLCSISTRGRYHSTLPLTLQAVMNQSTLPNKIVIFDDNDNPEDMSTNLIYSYIMKILPIKDVDIEWIIAEKKGQHYNHQKANLMGYDWVWRVDDDCIPEPNVLENLLSYVDTDVGAVGGAILTPPYTNIQATGRIEDVFSEPNIQWAPISEVRSVDHLHCSFIYRSGIYYYNTGLSRVAHREETLFTFGIKQNGYKVLVVPNATSWHFKNPEGGIRSESNMKLFEHDETIFKNHMLLRSNTIVVLDCNLEYHLIFQKMLNEIKNPIVFTSFPDVIPGISITQAPLMLGNIDMYNIEKRMAEWNLNDAPEKAFRKLYLPKTL